METKKLFDGEYEVTSEGEVFSLKKGGCRLLKGAVFRSGHGSTCYRTVLLTINGKQKKDVYKRQGMYCIVRRSVS